MKITRNHLYALLFFLVVFFFPIFAVVADNQNEPFSESISLTEAIHIAVGQNPEIKAARFQMDAVKSNFLKARSGFYPQLSFAQAFTRTTNPMWAFGTKLNQGVIASSDFDPDSLNDPDAINNFASTFSLSWPIYEGGRTKLDWEQAKEKLSVASLALERTRQNVIARTATAYVGLVLAQKDIMVINEALKTAEANIKMIRSRYNSGLVVKSDLLRTMVRRADLEQKQLMAKSRLKIGEAMLNAVMGSGDAKPLNPVTPLTIAPEIAGTIDYWVNTALQNRPEMEKWFLAEDIAKKEIKKSRAHHYPDVNLVGNYEINTKDFSDSADNYTIGAVLKINIFSRQRINE